MHTLEDLKSGALTGYHWGITRKQAMIGWEAGQLEKEIAQNSWLTVEADPKIIFDLPADERYDAALALLGIDFAMLSEEAGHA